MREEQCFLLMKLKNKGGFHKPTDKIITSLNRTELNLNSQPFDLTGVIIHKHYGQ